MKILQSKMVVGGVALLVGLCGFCHAESTPDPAAAHAAFREEHGVVAPRADWTNSLVPVTPQDAEVIKLAEDNQARYGILIPADATPDEQTAADELAMWLRMICGAEFTIITEGATPLDKPVISIGETRAFAAAGFENADLKQDGYRIDYQKNSGNLFIQGGSRKGILNGVYALLEEDLGCRWYPLDTTVIPTKTNLQLTVAPRVYVSPFDALRWFYFSDTIDDQNWQQRNRCRVLNNVSRQFVHTYHMYIPPKEYFETHPEYFPLINGKRTQSQICPSNPDVRKIILEDIKERLKAKPTAEYVDVSPNDSEAYCECPECAKIIKREGTVMGPLLSLVNFIADNIKKDYPNVLVTTLAYTNTIFPPKTFGPRPNVKIWLCTDKHAWGFGDLFFSETDKSSKFLKAWKDKWNAAMLIWDYPCNYSSVRLHFNLPVVAANMRYYVKNGGANGLFFEGGHGGSGGAYGIPQGYLRSWIFSKLAWNPNLDTKALVRDFTYGFYGPAAPQMQAWEEFLWKTWQDWHTETMAAHPAPWNPEEAREKKWSGKVDVADDDAFEAKAEKYLIAAANAVATNSPYRSRIEATNLPFIYQKLEKGPQDGKEKEYLDLKNEFERLARAVRISCVESTIQGPDLRKKLDYWKKLTEPLPEIPYIEFSKTWFFMPDLKNEGIKAGWYKPEISELNWHPIQIGDWRKQGYNNDLRTGWYRQRFNATAAMLKRDTLWMLFGGVDETAEVYINGKLAFSQTPESTGLSVGDLWNRPFVFDAKPFLKAGENLLAVRVTRTAMQGGIWRPVGFLLQDEKPNASKAFYDIEEMLTVKKVKEANQ